jgi:hypothetical protein
MDTVFHAVIDYTRQRLGVLAFNRVAWITIAFGFHASQQRCSGTRRLASALPCVDSQPGASRGEDTWQTAERILDVAVVKVA